MVFRTDSMVPAETHGADESSSGDRRKHLRHVSFRDDEFHRSLAVSWKNFFSISSIRLADDPGFTMDYRSDRACLIGDSAFFFKGSKA